MGDAAGATRLNIRRSWFRIWLPVMPSARSKQREIERERRRRRLRRQRWAVALIVLLGIGTGAGLLLSRGSGIPRLTTAVSQPSTKPSGRRAAPLRLPALARAWVASFGRLAARSSLLREQTAVDFFAARGDPLYCGGSSGRYVALTFDDGPGPYTDLVLQILERAHARATFFLVGRNVMPRESMAMAELEDSSALGIHTWSHLSLVGISRSEIKSQITRTGSAIFRATGYRSHLFRPPYGNRDARVDRIVSGLGMVEVLWSIDSDDSQGKNWRGIAHEVLGNVEPGSIILLHDNRGQTVRALKQLILPGLRKRGFIPVTIPELLVLDPPPVSGAPLDCWEHWHPY
ncbi:MAG: polysaccharide deacetylase family protein [Gaiellaceae bacterium]|jgi:peptidoglycan/xylan/chitin deacetylase (PgdA/CDA1 family)